MAKHKKKNILTPEGYNKFKEEYKYLVEVKRPKVSERIRIASEFGDLSENSEYDAAKEEQSFIEGRIAELEEILRNVELVEEKKSDFVVVGSKVVVEFNGEKDEFVIVGPLEADPVMGKISNESPVGKALLGAKVGEVVEVVTPDVKIEYRVLEIK